MSSLPIWNSSSLPLNYLIHNDSKKKKKNLIHNKHARKYIGSERGKRGTKKRESFTPWELGLGTAREEVFLLKSEMGLLCRRRNRTSLKLCRSFGKIVTQLGSWSYGGSENWFIEAIVMAKREAWPCVDWYRAAVTMDWRRGREWVEGEAAAQGRERENLSLWKVRAETETVGRGNFLRAK